LDLTDGRIPLSIVSIISFYSVMDIKYPRLYAKQTVCFYSIYRTLYKADKQPCFGAVKRQAGPGHTNQDKTTWTSGWISFVNKSMTLGRRLISIWTAWVVNWQQLSPKSSTNLSYFTTRSFSRSRGRSKSNDSSTSTINKPSYIRNMQNLKGW